MRKQVLSLLVENTSGVLSHISGLFSRRGYNIDSFSAGVTADPRFTRITVVSSGDEQILEQIGAADKKTAVRVLLDEGYLLTPEKNRIKAKISIDGVVSYGYRFCYPKIDEAFGSVNDAVYTYKRQSLGPMQIMEEREAAYGRNYQITDQPKPIEGKLFLL